MKMPNGYGSVTKLSGKRRKPYCVRSGCRYSINGEKLKETRQIIGYYSTRREAVEALAEYNRDPYDIDVAKLTLNDIFIKWKDKSKLSEKTLYTYESAYQKLIPMEQRIFKDIAYGELQNLIDEIKPSMQRQVKNLLHNLYDFAIRNEFVDKDLSAHLELSQMGEKAARNPFTEDEIEKLWSLPPNIERDLTLILIYSGWRAKELISCKIDLEANTMTGGVKTAAGKNRVVPIHPRIRGLIETDIKKIQKLAYATVYKYVSKFGHIPHECRHTFISRLIAAGADEIIVQKLVGHSGNVTRDVYTHIELEALQKTVNLLP